MVELKRLAPIVASIGLAGIIYAVSVRKTQPELAENIALVVAGGASFTSLLMNMLQPQ